MALITILVGLFFVAGGVSVFVRPRIQGARDADLITSAEPGDAERWTASVGGFVLVLIGAGFCYLGL